MEIEAKFSAPDAATLERLGELAELAGYQVAGRDVADVSDVYVDTAEHDLQAAGLVCRRRDRGDRVVLTVKRRATPAGAGDGAGAVHRRDEWEVDLPAGLAADAPPSTWPPSEARKQVLAAGHDRPLAPLAELRQNRVTRDLARDGRTIAELSLDTLTIVVGGGARPAQHEVEAELKGDGTEDDLAAIAATLQRDFALAPQPLSKFERAMAATQGGPQAARRARRMLPRGARRRPPPQRPSSAAKRDVADGRVGRAVRRRPALRRPGAPAHAHRAAHRRRRAPRPRAAGPARRRPAARRRGARRHGAAHGALLAQPLSHRGSRHLPRAPRRSTAPRRRGRGRARRRPSDGRRGAPGRRARRAARPPGRLATAEADTTADAPRPSAAPPRSCATRPSARARPPRRPLPRSASRHRHLCRPARPQGDDAHGVDAQRRRPRRLPQTKLRQRRPRRSPRQTPPAPRSAGPAPRHQGDRHHGRGRLQDAALSPDRMLEHEAGTRADDDIEDLHDMRVATRRMRAALRVFEPYLDAQALRPVERGLSAPVTCSAPCATSTSFTRRPCATSTRCPSSATATSTRCSPYGRERRLEARAALLAYLDGDRYPRFVESLTGLLDDPGARQPRLCLRRRRGASAPRGPRAARRALRPRRRGLGLRRRHRRPRHAARALSPAAHRRQGACATRSSSSKRSWARRPSRW